MGKKILTFGDLKVGDSIHIIDQPDKISSFELLFIFKQYPSYILLCTLTPTSRLVVDIDPNKTSYGNVFSDYDEAKSSLVNSFPLFTFIPPSC